MAPSSRLILILLLAAVCLPSRAGANEERELDGYITQFLVSMQFAPTLKRSAVDAASLPGRSTSFLKAVANAPDEQIIAAVVPIFRPELTLKEAAEIAEFYSSDSMKAITRQQTADPYNPDPALRVTSQQKADYDAFVVSEAGAAAIRLHTLIQSPPFMQQVNQRLIAALGVKIE